ncbi:DUF3396 domain-containing protein [Ruegeria sp. WL0004]|uniref:DUF3396 domain-containing protein n=1 Tax=Ruegeria marisflavi TaxID=2984152 RepID=A0ABT2WVY3_9RHOB|nr:DUF3396 domain-containing protein [Ruegeria sp. WL0004]MCU9840060.1 DUF3396 domain-containing protein [Ruegeria sp. WL0004]
MELPPPLASPGSIEGKPAFKVLHELIFYHDELKIGQFDALLDLWRSICPSDRLTLFTISELDFWSQLTNPVLTQSARAAAAERLSWPMFEATRRRIQMGRALKAHIWDGRKIEQASGTWSMEIRRLHRRDSGLHGYVRMLFPIDTDTGLLIETARQLGNLLPAYSGHGGPVFTYEPDLRFQAFRAIHSVARRFHGIDVEDLRITLPMMRDRWKSPCWLNFFGIGSAPEGDVGIRRMDGVRVFDLTHGTLYVLGDRPEVLDVNRPPVRSETYQTMARLMSNRFIEEVGEFSGAGWLEDAGSADSWLTRFLPESGWFPRDRL